MESSTVCGAESDTLPVLNSELKPYRCTQYCHFDLAGVEEEKSCCKDNDLSVTSLENHECNTEHPSFEKIVLNPAVLEVAFVQIMAYKKSRARAPTVLAHRY